MTSERTSLAAWPARVAALPAVLDHAEGVVGPLLAPKQLHQIALDLDGIVFRAQAEAPVHPLRLCKEINEYLEEDDMLVIDGGDTQVWMNMVRTNRKPGTNLESGLFGCLGVGLPFSAARRR